MSDDHHPLESADSREFNDELRRQGFGRTVYFDSGDAALTADAQEILSRNSGLLRRYVDVRFQVIIEGHTDSRGTNEDNIALGERRADAVRAYLQAMGVAADRLATISYGEERPVCEQPDESCWALNRRVEMRVRR